MKYFVFRNSTVEPFFDALNAAYSGYNDISFFSDEAEVYIWFYILDPNIERINQIKEIDHFYDRLRFVVNKLPPNKDLYIFSIVKIFSIKWQDVDTELENKIADFNIKVSDLADLHPNIRIISFDEFTNQFDSERLINWKYFYTSQITLNPALSESFRNWFQSKVKSIKLIRKKCIILDLDNTLWGGVLGEDGIQGIQMGDTYPGNCFSDFQRYLIDASDHGIILALCSKNNEKDVLEVFEKHPSMLLKMSNIVAHRINWTNKPQNIIELAREINIGLDSIVFIDDSPVERDLVRKAIPEVSVPEFPEKPYHLTQFLKKVLDDHFQIYRLTEEDSKKITQYKENKLRDDLKNQFVSLDDYLGSLGIEIVIKRADQFTVPRISQMTQKTNQFNLTTKRYSENEILQFVKNNDLVLCASVRDKFGDNGITLLTIVCVDESGTSCYIDSFLLSCRILGRGIETAFLNFVMNEVYKKGIRKVEASYIPTLKNEQAKFFYDNNGFDMIDRDDDKTLYSKKLNGELEIKSYYKIIYQDNE